MWTCLRAFNALPRMCVCVYCHTHGSWLWLLMCVRVFPCACMHLVYMVLRFWSNVTLTRRCGASHHQACQKTGCSSMCVDNAVIRCVCQRNGLYAHFTSVWLGLFVCLCPTPCVCLSYSPQKREDCCQPALAVGSRRLTGSLLLQALWAAVTQGLLRGVAEERLCCTHMCQSVSTAAIAPSDGVHHLGSSKSAAGLLFVVVRLPDWPTLDALCPSVCGQIDVLRPSTPRTNCKLVGC